MDKSIFDHHTGYAWCEEPYGTHENIVEFWNTWTSLAITLAGWMIVGHSPHIEWTRGTLALMGLSSAYYHATRAAFGQFLDELFIVLFAGHICISVYRVSKFYQDEGHFRKFVYGLCVVQGAYSLYDPHFSQVTLVATLTFLISTSFVCMQRVHAYLREMNQSDHVLKAHIYMFVSSMWFGSAVWGFERAFPCDYLDPDGFWMSLCHPLWHILAALGGMSIGSYVEQAFYDLKIQYDDGKGVGLPI